MANRGLWAGIAGAANALGGVLQAREADERKQKLYMMEQDILQKRQEALASLRGDIQDKNAGNRSDRALDRMETKHAMESGDITGQFQDPETGNYYGRAKNGNIVPLNITSDDYQGTLKSTRDSKADAAALQPDRIRGQMAQTDASTANLQSTTSRREATPIADPQGDKIRADYQKQIGAARVQAINAAKQAAKDGKPGVPFDENEAGQTVAAQLYSVYGADAVKNAMGGGNNTASPVNTSMPGTQAGASTTAPGVPAAIANRAAAPNHTAADTNASLAADGGLAATAKPGVPSPTELLQKFNAASAQVGNDPQKQAALQKRLNDLMQQYGYGDLLNQQQQ